MGLMLVRQGTITVAQLHTALEEQRRASQEGSEREELGEWLLESGVLAEPALTRALSLQWNCPVFSLDGFEPEAMAAACRDFSPRPSEPSRANLGARLLYMAFSGGVDRSLGYAVERMTGLRVAAGIAPDSEFRLARERIFRGGAAGTVPGGSQLLGAGAEIARRVEAAQAVESRLVRVHDFFWVRIWRRAPAGPGPPAPDTVEDLLATVGSVVRPQDRTLG